nr:hypothetical protein [Paraburkholderia sp. CNPSo 3274]
MQASSAVVEMVLWSRDLTAKIGCDLPIAVKRGYHMHYAVTNGAKLNQPVLDEEAGFLIPPRLRGVRLTTGVELGYRDTARTPVQLEADEALARGIFPLSARADPAPWRGCRPCTPACCRSLGQRRSTTTSGSHSDTPTMV